MSKMRNILSKILIILITSVTLSIIPSCDREDRIPYVYVNFVIYPDLPEYMSIKTPGNYLFLTGGVQGIILYCQFTDEYMAYERNCPNDPYENNAVLDVDSTGLFLVCRNCGSRFSIYDGSIVESPSKYPVLQYATYLDNSALYINNQY
jgi:nitrite reductase/ring-hydroxylating ferredoxin subunit